MNSPIPYCSHFAHSYTMLQSCYTQFYDTTVILHTVTLHQSYQYWRTVTCHLNLMSILTNCFQLTSAWNILKTYLQSSWLRAAVFQFGLKYQSPNFSFYTKTKTTLRSFTVSKSWFSGFKIVKVQELQKVSENPNSKKKVFVQSQSNVSDEIHRWICSIISSWYFALLNTNRDC